MDRKLEELVWERAGHRCEYCQVAQDLDRLPFSTRGATSGADTFVGTDPSWSVSLQSAGPPSTSCRSTSTTASPSARDLLTRACSHRPRRHARNGEILMP